MSSDDRFSFVLTALLATVVLLSASKMRVGPAPGIPAKPLVGRAASDVPVGPAADVERPEEPGDVLVQPAAARVRALLETRAWPGFARGVVFHPLPHAALGGDGLEEGPPWHVVIEPDGALRWTPRGRSGTKSQPPGLPFRAATEALHVALPECGRATAESLASARALWGAAVGRFGPGAVVFADEVPGSSATMPAGFDRASCVAPQDTRRAETEPRGTSTQPASRGTSLAIKFGKTTIHAGLALTADQRRDGLSGRRSLAKDEGLLFVYRVAEPHSFWMKGCLIALDIIYVADDGTVLSIVTAPPPDPSVREVDLPRYVSPAPTRLVLEIEGGSGAKIGLKRGSRLELPAGTAQLFEKAES